jgi:hypothetical protein
MDELHSRRRLEYNGEEEEHLSVGELTLRCSQWYRNIEEWCLLVCYAVWLL